MLIPNADWRAKGGHLIRPRVVISHKRLAELLMDKLGIGMKDHADTEQA